MKKHIQQLNVHGQLFGIFMLVGTRKDLFSKILLYKSLEPEITNFQFGASRTVNHHAFG